MTKGAKTVLNRCRPIRYQAVSTIRRRYINCTRFECRGNCMV